MSLDSWGDALSKVFWVQVDLMTRSVAKWRGIGRIGRTERATRLLCREFTDKIFDLSTRTQRINGRAR
jgi:hypothetical protein